MLTTEQKQTFAEEGYLVFKKLFPETLMEEMIREAKIIANKESLSWEQEGVLQAWYANIILRYPSFVQALEYPTLDELRKSLDSDFQLMTAELTSGLVLCSSGQGMTDWHRDIDFINVPEFQPNQAVAQIFLQDTTIAAIEPMRVLPGSHKSDYQLNHYGSFESLTGEVSLAFPSGTVLLYHENLWHIHGSNNSEKDYWLLIFHYGRPKAT